MSNQKPAGRVLSYAVSTAVLLLAGCSADALPTAPATNVPVSFAGAKPAPGFNASVIITFADLAGNRISSDGGGAYTDAVNGVAAAIVDGGLTVQTGANRTIAFDFTGAAVDPLNQFIPNQTGKQSVTIVMNGGPDLGALAIGTTACQRLAFVFAGTLQQNSVLYHGYAAATDDNTTFAYVTKTSATGWTFTSYQPAGATKCGTAPDDQVLVQSQDLTVRKSQMLPKGYYRMRFSFQAAVK